MTAEEEQVNGTPESGAANETGTLEDEKLAKKLAKETQSHGVTVGAVSVAPNQIPQGTGSKREGKTGSPTLSYFGPKTDETIKRDSKETKEDLEALQQEDGEELEEEGSMTEEGDNMGFVEHDTHADADGSSPEDFIKRSYASIQALPPGPHRISTSSSTKDLKDAGDDVVSAENDTNADADIKADIRGAMASSEEMPAQRLSTSSNKEQSLDEPEQSPQAPEQQPDPEGGDPPPPLPTTALQRGRTLQPTAPSLPGAHAHSTTNLGRAVSAPLTPTNAREERATVRPSVLAASMELLFGSSDVPFLEATLVSEHDDSSQGRHGGNVRNSNVRSSNRMSHHLRRSQLFLAHATPLDEDPNHCCVITCACCSSSDEKRPRLLWTLVVAGLVILGLGLGLGFGLSAQNGSDPNSRPTLQTVRDRGVLRCGVGSISPGLHYVDENGERRGLDVALCRAIAAAVLGDAAQVEFRSSSFKTRFPALLDHQVDVVAAGTTHTMEREISEKGTLTGFSFSEPYLYEGLQLAGDPHSVGCMEQESKNMEGCGLLVVCVIEGTSHHTILSRRLPGKQLNVVEDYDAMIQAFVKRQCGLIAHEGHQLQEKSIRDLGYRGGYRLGDHILSKEPLCLVSRKGDTEWTSFVNTVLHGLLVAEKHNITQSTAHLFPEITVFGDDYKDMFRNAIAVEGHYGDLYTRYLEYLVPRKAVNLINDNTKNTSGLLYPHPLGNVENDGNEVVGYMEQLQIQETIRCGIIPRRPGFAAVPAGGYSYKGIEIDLCRALSAALFDGSSTEIELVVVDNEEEGFDALENGLVDVFAGASWNFETYSQKTATGNHFSFSPSYFYNNTAVSTHEENLCLVTAATDLTWSSFVNWIVAGLMHAEEQGITKDDSNDMPRVNLVGDTYSRMFRDVVLAVGNYGEMYNNSLQDLYPRQGRNLLNSGFTPGPQHYPLPGLFEH